MLTVLSHWAAQAGASGDLITRAAILASPPNNDSDLESMAIVRIAENDPANGAVFGKRAIAGSIGLRDPEPVDHTFPNMIAAERPDIISAAFEISSELLAEFGADGPALLRSDGTIAPAASEEGRILRAWANGSGG